MGLAMMVNVGVVALNVALLSVLIVLYARMLREVATRLTWGLLAFASVLWLQNALQLYFFATMMDLYVAGLDGIVLAQNVLAMLASVFLLAVTIDPVGKARRTADA